MSRWVYTTMRYLHDGSMTELSTKMKTVERDAIESSSHYEDQSRGLCTRAEILEGSWKTIELDAPPYIPKNAHLRCYPEMTYREGTWRTFEWRPTHPTCSFDHFNASMYCSLMQLGTILIAGDSLSWEQYSSLGQLLGLRIHQTSQFISKEKSQNHVQFGCNLQSRLVFRRDDLLSDLSAAIAEAFPTVIVLNRGAHYQNDTALLSGIRHNIEELKAWKQQCLAYGFKCHLFWRTSVPGHPSCTEKNFSEPINDLHSMEQLIANRSNYNERTIKYHWYDYQHQNKLVLNELNNGLGDDGFQVLDAYHLNVRRPDEHRAHQGDCLHNCYPGKMDLYNQLLLHFLQMGRNQSDVDRLTQLFNTARDSQTPS